MSFLLCCILIINFYCSTSRVCCLGDIQDLLNHPGHLKPYGSHGEVRHPDEIDHFPSISEFFENYVSSSTALVMRGVVKDSKAYKEWTDEYFLSLPIPPDDLLKIRIYEDPQFRPRIHLHDFVKTYNDTNDWIINEIPTYLGKDVPLPPPINCEEVHPHLHVANFFYSKGGTNTNVHNDGRDNILCVYAGRKEIILLHPDQYINKVNNIDPSAVALSFLDIERVDFTKHPDMANIEYFHKVNMTAGDCLFLPYNWIHVVYSYERNIAVNTWWHHQDDVTSIVEKCKTAKPNNLTISDKVHVRLFEGYLPKLQINYYLSDMTRAQSAPLSDIIQDFLDLLIIRQYNVKLFQEPGQGGNQINTGKFSEENMDKIRNDPGVKSQYATKIIPLLTALDINRDGFVTHEELFSDTVQNQILPNLYKNAMSVGKLTFALTAKFPQVTEIKTLESIKKKLQESKEGGERNKEMHSEL